MYDAYYMHTVHTTVGVITQNKNVFNFVQIWQAWPNIIKKKHLKQVLFPEQKHAIKKYDGTL